MGNGCMYYNKNYYYLLLKLISSFIHLHIIVLLQKQAFIDNNNIKIEYDILID